MKIPPDQNTRAEAMWRIISQSVDFRNKRVIDLGCGTGDFLWRAYVAGAKYSLGIDRNILRIDDLQEAFLENEFISSDAIDLERRSLIPNNYNIAFCFSVLPYLDDVPGTLKWMADNFPLCLIECQYADDGPGLSNIGGDRGMMQFLLNNGFNRVLSLGRTMVKDRFYPNGKQVYRTIWRCSA